MTEPKCVRKWNKLGYWDCTTHKRRFIKCVEDKGGEEENGATYLKTPKEKYNPPPKEIIELNKKRKVMKRGRRFNVG